MRRMLTALMVVAGACGDGEQLLLPDAAEPGITLAVGPFELPPGGEATKCQWFSNPMGADIEVREFEVHSTEGTHHLTLTSSEELEEAPLADCVPGLTVDDLMLFGSQRADARQAYPAGVAVPIAANRGLRIQLHYFNASDAPVTISSEVTMRLAEPGTVTMHAGHVQYSNQNFAIAPGAQRVAVPRTCTVPADMNVIFAAGHMHRHGVLFSARTGGEEIYRSESWSEPTPVVFDPPLQLKKGQKIDFACTYTNDTNETVAFGDSADTDEMCIFGTRVYPVPTLPGGSFACY